MAITIEQARALQAVAETGSFAKASAALGKSHSAIVYAIKEIENQTKLVVLDRSQYRNAFTDHGRRVLEECRKLLDAERDLNQLCRDLSSGWEPYVLIVYEGFVPFAPIARATMRLAGRHIPTRIRVISDFHSGVEESFDRHAAQMMISILPPAKGSFEAIPLTPLNSLLVAHKSHPLVQEGAGGHVTLSELRKHCYVTVRRSDTRLNLSTSPLDEDSNFQVSDFYAKKQALLTGVGFGWMPEYLVNDELKNGDLRLLQWSKPGKQIYFPHLYHRGSQSLGRAGLAFLEEYLSLQQTPDCQKCTTHEAVFTSPSPTLHSGWSLGEGLAKDFL